MPTLIYRFLDGSLESESFVDNDIVEHILERVSEWKRERGLIAKQIVIAGVDGRVIMQRSGLYDNIVPDKESPTTYTFSVLILPLLSIESLNDQEVDEVYNISTNCEEKEPCNEDSYRRFACVLWVNRVYHGRYAYDTVFYRVKETHRQGSSTSITAVSYGGSGEQPCWEQAIPMTRLAAERWDRLVEEYRARGE